MGPTHPQNDLTPATFQARVLGFLGLGIVALGIVFCLPPIPQDQCYHAFAAALQFALARQSSSLLRGEALGQRLWLALKAVDAKLPPAGGEVGLGDFADAGGHRLIIAVSS